METNKIGKDDYAVYNHPERPGIGKDHFGNFRYNCFWISLETHDGKYLSFTFSDFIKQFNRFYPNTCNSCVKNKKIYTFDGIDRAACDLKFSQRGFYHENEQEIEQEIQQSRSAYYYCPLIARTLENCTLEPLTQSDFRLHNTLPNIEPINSILCFSEDGRYSNSWDDYYFFQILNIQHPRRFSSTCSICSRLASEEFIPQNAEKMFLKMYMLSAFECLNQVCSSHERLYLEEKDFQYDESKFFDFIFPIPQVWIYVIPKPPPGSNWRDWESKQKSEIPLPQRVDFLLTYQGKRHIIELDGASHYSSKGAYRETLADTRWLKRCGYQVHRFANEEILELYSASNPNLEGFKDLLYSEGLDLEKIILTKTSEIAPLA